MPQGVPNRPVGSVSIASMLTPGEAVAELTRGHRELHALLAGIPVDDLEEPGTIGGGEWSAKDLVGHLTSWEEIALRTLDQWRAGSRPTIADTIAAGGTDQLNADEVARTSARPVAEVLRRSDATHRELSGALGAIPQAEWDAEATFEPHRPNETLGSFLGGVLGSDAGPFLHHLAHQRDLRAFASVRAPG